MTSWYVWAFDGVGGAVGVAIGVAMYQRYSAGKRQKNKVTATRVKGHSVAAVQSPDSVIVGAPMTGSSVAIGSNITQAQEVHHHYHAEAENAPQWTTTEPTPQGLAKEIDDALPFDQAHVRKKFVGLPVVWQVHLSSIEHVGAGFTVYVAQRPYEFPMIRFNLGSLPPELRTATQTSVFLVRGVIEEASQVTLVLKDDPELLLLKRA